MSKIRAFSMAEILVAMGIIGILCVSMLSLNSMSDNNYKVASTKLAQTDSALKSWGRAISKVNETNQGVVPLIASKAANEHIGQQEALVALVEAEMTTTAPNKQKDGVTTLTLNNGTTLDIEYLGNQNNITNEATGDVYEYDVYGSPLALFTIKSEVKGKSLTLSDRVVLLANGKMVSEEDLYDDSWSVYKADEGKDVYQKDGDGNDVTDSDGNKVPEKRTYCANTPCDGTTPTIITDQTIQDEIHVKTDGSTACGYNQSGSVTTYIIGTAKGQFRYLSSSVLLRISKLSILVFPKPIPGSTIMFSCFIPFDKAKSILDLSPKNISSIRFPY